MRRGSVLSIPCLRPQFLKNSFAVVFSTTLKLVYSHIQREELPT